MANFSSNIYLSAHAFTLPANPPVATFLVLSVVYLSEWTHKENSDAQYSFFNFCVINLGQVLSFHAFPELYWSETPGKAHQSVIMCNLYKSWVSRGQKSSLGILTTAP